MAEPVASPQAVLDYWFCPDPARASLAERRPLWFGKDPAVDAAIRTRFAADPRAREAARAVLARGHDLEVAPVQRLFLYLPFEHSEDLDDQRLSVRLFAALADASTGMDLAYDYALRHYCVIQRFGRFPHRNAILGRASTPAEEAFLQEPGSRFKASRHKPGLAAGWPRPWGPCPPHQSRPTDLY